MPWFRSRARHFTRDAAARSGRPVGVPTIVTYQVLADRARAGQLPGDIEIKLREVIDGTLGALELAHAAGLPTCS